MIFFEEGDRKVVPFQRVASLLGLSTLFCWVIDGAQWILHNPESPGSMSGRGGVGWCLKAAFAFLAPAKL